MNKTNASYLYNTFPRLYQQRDSPLTQTCMCWGFECGDGWFDLLKKLSERLEEISTLKGLDIQAVQVKEKYGTLRFYIEGGDDEANKAIDEAEKESEHTCEQCGKEGRATERWGWYRTLCQECETKRSNN